MLTLNQVREKLPGLKRFNDADAVEYLQSRYYKDVPVEQLAKEFGVDMPKAPEPPKESAGFWRSAADLGIKGAQGVVDVGASAIGLGNIATGGLVGQGMDAIGYDPKRTNAMLGEYLSDDQKAADQAVAQAQGFTDTLGAAVANPRAITGSVAQSLPGLFAMGGVQGAIAKQIGGKAAAAAVAEGKTGAAVVDAAQAAIDAAGKRLMAYGAATEGAQTAGNIAQSAQADGRTWSEYTPGALAGGLGTAAIGYGAGRLMGDAGTGIFTGSKGAGVAGSLPARVGKSAFSEGVLEEMPQSAQEQVFTNVALGKEDVTEGVGNASAMGLLAGAAMGGVMGGFSKPASPAAERKATDLETKAKEIRQNELVPEVGPLTRLANAETEQKAQELEKSAAAVRAIDVGGSVGDGMGGTSKIGLQAAFNSLAGGGVSEDFYNKAFQSLVDGKDTVSGVKDPILAMAKPAFDAGQIKSPGDLREFVQSGSESNSSAEPPVLALDDAADADKAAYEAHFNAPAPAAFVAMPEEKRKLILQSNARVSDGGQEFAGAQDGDILTGIGQPFKTQLAARSRARMFGPDFTAVPVFDGYVIRQKANIQPQITQDISQGVPSVDEAAQTVQATQEGQAQPAAATVAQPLAQPPIAPQETQPAQPAAIAGEGAGASQPTQEVPTSATSATLSATSATSATSDSASVDAQQAGASAVSAQYKAADEQGKAALKPEMDKLNAEIAALRSESLMDVKRAVSEGGKQKQTKREAEYGAMPEGTRLRPSEFDESKGIHWEKTGPDEWTGRGEWFNNGKTRTTAQMAEHGGYMAMAAKPSANDYLASVEQAKKDAQQAAKDAPKEIVTPADDKVIGKNNAGETLYERKDGSVYRMRDGKPDFGGDLAPKESSKKYTNGQQLGSDDLLSYFDEVIAESAKGEHVVNPRFHIGEVDSEAAQEIAKYIDGYAGEQRKLRVSGRTLKHIHESRPTIARDIVEKLPGMFSQPDEVLPDPNHVHKRALLVKEPKQVQGQSKTNSHVATVEVEIEVEVHDGFIDIVTIMTAPDRSLRKARELKKNWPEGQQRTEQAVNSPHPLTASAANPEADSPDARPVGESVSPSEPEVKAITQEDVAGAESQALIQIQDELGKRTAQAVQKFGATFLPSMGLPLVKGKAKIIEAMASPKVNLQAAASELGIQLPKSVNAALQAKFEGRIGEVPSAETPIHKEPGKAPEVATPAVVTENLNKAARNEDKKPSEMRKWLLAEIDKALLTAPDRQDYDEAVKRMGEKDAISMYTGNGILGKGESAGLLTFDVPGDGKFKIRNSVRGLLEFRKNVEKSPGFKDSSPKFKHGDVTWGVQGGSGGVMPAITNMIEEGDFEAAKEFAEANGVKLEDVKVPRGERLPQWKEFLKDGTVPAQPDTKPQPAPKTAAQLDEEKRQAKEAEATKPKDTGWNMRGTGYAGKLYKGRNITLDDGREVVARVYEHAGRYVEVDVKVDGVRKYAVTDDYNAQEKADAFIATLIGEKKENTVPEASEAKATIPEGYKPAGEPFYRNGKLTQGYAPFTTGDRVTMRDAGGQSGVVESFIKPDVNGVFESASVKFDNGVQIAVPFTKLDAEQPQVSLTVENALAEIEKAKMVGRDALYRELATIRGLSNSVFNGVANSLTGSYTKDGAEWTQESLTDFLMQKEPTKSSGPTAKAVDQEPTSKTPLFDAHEAIMQAVRDGTATPEQFKESFESVVANEAAIKAELGTKTKEQLLKDGGPFVRMRYANEKKSDIIDVLYREMVGEFALGQSVSYGMERGSYQKAVRRLVEATDADKLAQYVKDRKEALEARVAELKARAESLENPQSLTDYRRLIQSHINEGKTRKEAFLMLTPEQRMQYDTLEAESTKEARESRKRAAKTEVRTAGQSTGGEIIATKHTRDNYDLFVVQLSDRLSREDYQTVLASAKKLGGWYSAFRGNGAVPGFQFKSRESAQAFLALAGGDTTQAQEQVAQRRDAFEDDRSQSAAERLNEMADKLTEAAEEELGRERKANTARRARFASSAINAAEAGKALAKTMRNIAKAIGEGKAKFLDAVRTKTQVEMLSSTVRTAKDNELRAKYESYADQEKRKGEPATAETADFAEFPTFTAFRSDLAMLARQMLEVEGTKKLGQQLMKVADDVTDTYLEFAKANIIDVSAYGNSRNVLADFDNKADAENAIRRNNLTGKAIVLPMKRGHNRVILSPSEAMNRGIWKGDGDKRITLSGDFGNELVEAIGRRGSKQNGLSVPWQFQNAYDRRKALARIGVETPSEFRSALREYIALQERAVANKARDMELAMVGRKADGLDFFPTPSEVADQMVEAADIKPDMAVLEPSAGMGHIADRIRESGAEPDVIELAADRRELLQEKGFHLAEVDDFMQLEPRKFFTYGDVFRAPDGVEGTMRGVGSMGSQRVRLEDENGNRLGLYDRSELTGVAHRGTWSGYDRIIMNPPFSNRRDAEHVQHAYTLLRPGGRIVAIMGEGVFFGSDKKAQEFREWLDSVGGTSEKLPAGTFMDPSLPVNTGVSARMVVIDKPTTAPVFSQNLVAPQSTGPKPTLEQIQRFVDKVLKVAKNVIPVTVIASPHDLAGVKLPVGGKPTGAVVEGRIYLFADNINSTGDAYVTLFHEIFHLGLQKVIPAEDYAALLKQFAASPVVAKYIRMWKASAEGVQKAKTMPTQSYEALANEEALAMVSEVLSANDGIGTKNLPGLAKVVLNWMAKVADAIGFPSEFSNWVRDLTRTDAERFVNDMVRAVLGGQKNLAKTQAKYGTVVESLGGVGVRMSDKGAPLLAPNGKPSKLTPGQHAQVRTAAFKRFFGNWSYDPSMPVKVTSISGKEIGEGPLSAGQIKEWVLREQRWQDMDPVINADTGHEIGFTVQGVKDSLKRKSDTQRKAYAGLRDLLENAVFVDFEPVRADKTDEQYLEGYEVYYGALDVDGKLYGVRLKVELPKTAANRGRSYKDHKIVDVEVRPPAASLGSGDVPVVGYPGAGPTQTGGSTVSLGQIVGENKPVASKAVDENGEPLVLFHGTAYDFASFDAGRNRTELNDKYQGNGFHFSPDPRVASRYADADRNLLLRKQDIYPLIEQRFPGRIAQLFRDVVEHGYEKAWDLPDAEVSAIIQAGRDADVDLNDILDLAEVVEGSRYHAGRENADDPGAIFSALFGGSGGGLLSEYHIDDMLKLGLDAAAPKQNVMPVYLRTNNPLITDDRTKARAAQKNGYDGILYSGPDLVDGVPEWVVFDSTQIKSAIGNNGQFDSSNPDIRFSQGLLGSIAQAANNGQELSSTGFQQKARDYIGDLIKSSGKVTFWQRTIGTQYHKAQKHPAFKRVYDLVQDYISGTSAFANNSAELAKGILPQLESFADLNKAWLSKEDQAAISAPIFHGTLLYTRSEDGELVETSDVATAGVVFSDAELKDKFKLNNKQIDLYRQFRAAVDKSLSDAVVTDALRYLGKDIPANLKEMAVDNPAMVRQAITQMLEQKANETGKAWMDARAEMRSELNLFDRDSRSELAKVRGRPMEYKAKQQQVAEDRAKLESRLQAKVDKTEKAKSQAWKDQSRVRAKFDHIDSLIARGYAPLSRFGDYFVSVKNPETNEVTYFDRFDTEREANRAAREWAGEGEVSQGKLPKEAHRLFAGMTPETVEMFGNAVGVEQSEAFEAYIKLAKNQRSTMKRLIKRKGTAGYSEDVTRVLASFITSTARASSGNLYMGDATQAAKDIKDNDGKLQDEAVKLVKYVQDPTEEMQKLRGFMFIHFMGGSVASALVNMTQPFMMTLPWLSQHSNPAKATALLTKSIALAAKGVDKKSELGRALKRAEQDGTVSPQEVHQLQAEVTKSSANHRLLRKAAYVWGSMFSLAEQFNRRVTFIAAYQQAQADKHENPFAFAEHAVNETQGVYNKGNRVNWGRGAVGSTVMTFKQYTISYLEFLNRLPAREKLFALGLLMLAAGMQGLPGADDLDDLIDTLGQKMGYNWNTKREKRLFLESFLGRTAADFALRGVSAGLPLDVAGRLGTGNLLPGTGLLLEPKRDHTQDADEVLGPVDSLMTSAKDAIGAGLSGDVGGAAKAIAPVMAKNIIQALDMNKTGMYRDRGGHKVIDTDTTDAVFKAIGFQPSDVAKEQLRTRMVKQDIDLARAKEADIADKWANAKFIGDREGEESARQQMMSWNSKNPEARIRINIADILKRVRNMRLDKQKRTIKAATPEMRRYAEHGFQ